MENYNTYTTDGDKNFSVRITLPQKHNIIFRNDKNEKIGEMDFTDGVFKFTGKADESAKIFVKWVKEYFNQN